MKKSFLLVLASTALLLSCNNNGTQFDASGTFEADETIVSSELPGKILLFNVDEGMNLAKDSIIGTVDATSIDLQQQQVEASINALNQKTASPTEQVKLLQDQLSVQQTRLDNLLHERTRIENLLRADAATGKQLDDINYQVEALKKEMVMTQQQIN
ncbi:MAG TPA: HlyD family secretion protein, partial [Chitinophagaceae bacterium]